MRNFHVSPDLYEITNEYADDRPLLAEEMANNDVSSRFFYAPTYWLGALVVVASSRPLTYLATQSFNIAFLESISCTHHPDFMLPASLRQDSGDSWLHNASSLT